MDFIRKNWSRLSLAFLFLIGGVISIIAWVNNPFLTTKDLPWLYSFYFIAVLVATLLFFFGTVCVTILKSMANSKKIVSIVYMAMGGLITVLYLVLVVVAYCNKQPELISVFSDKMGIPGWGTYTFYMLWVPFIIFGLHPLIKGVTRFIEAETVPARANVQPTVQATAQPATETVAEAPKATARKSAPKTPAAK